VSSSSDVGSKEGPKVAALLAGFFLAAVIGIVVSRKVVSDKEGGNSLTH
jgi:hypothetical protein